jgi:2-(1,2-epoxy-1,2-dihydrophenyl)acetyl-CoA isomerase
MSTTYRDVVAAGRDATDQLVRVERRGDRATVVLDDPDRLNVLSAPLTVQLRARLDELVADPDVRTVILTGAGRGFSAGGDLRMMRDAVEQMAAPTDEEGATMPWQWIRGQFGAIARTIAQSHTACVAALNGPAAGVGLAFAFACDLVVASERAVLVPAFGKLGLMPEVGTNWHLVRRLGHQQAFAFYVAGEHVGAQRALELGLVTEVVAPEDLLAAAERWADRISALPPHAVAMTKPLLRAAADLPWAHALTMEEFAEPQAFTTAAFGRAVRGILDGER